MSWIQFPEERHNQKVDGQVYQQTLHADDEFFCTKLLVLETDNKIIVTLALAIKHDICDHCEHYEGHRARKSLDASEQTMGRAQEDA